jgi:hypothetical protein
MAIKITMIGIVDIKITSNVFILKCSSTIHSAFQQRPNISAIHASTMPALHRMTAIVV